MSASSKAATPDAGTTTPARRRQRTPGPVTGAVIELGEMTRFGARVLWMVVRRPWGFWGDAADQMYQILKQCWIPMAISTTFFG
ncbi:MAG: hypothetical protein GEV04_24420, partial [Actinophytocola sp.]|nr:hypothetical protein [Actinophytocola sp.]